MSGLYVNSCRISVSSPVVVPYVPACQGSSTVEKLDDKNTENASIGDSRKSPPDSSSSSSSSTRKMSNKEKFEFAELEKVVEVLSEKSKELEAQIAVAQETGRT